MNLQEGLDLRTAKLFKDLMQFHTGERSQQEIVLSQDSIVSGATPNNYSASFIPAISQKNLASNDSIGQRGFVNVVTEENN